MPPPRRFPGMPPSRSVMPVDDPRFLDAVRAAVSSAWRVERPRNGPWLGARRRDSRIPAEGWKLHVSATVGSAAEVLERVLRVLVAEGVPFKLAASPEVLAALNEGEGGLEQAGKFLTAYPADAEQAVRLAVALDEATRELPGPRVVTDRALRPGSLVHYRYGAFRGGPGEPEPLAPQVDPFVAAGMAKPEEQGAIGGRYVLVSTLHRSVGGSVHLAADLRLGRACVIKRAARDAHVGPDGRDARDRLRHEAEILERLAPSPYVPTPIEIFDEGGDRFLVMELVEGSPLGEVVDGPAGTARAVELGRALAAALGAVHAAGLVYRDLGPANAIVGRDGNVRLVDFELTCAAGERGEVAGTPGYASPQQLAGEPAEAADDVYALGAVLAFVATGADPSPDVAVPDERLARVVARCLEPSPEARYPSMDALDAALAELEAS